MVGRKSRVATRLTRNNTSMLSIHCIINGLALELPNQLTLLSSCTSLMKYLLEFSNFTIIEFSKAACYEENPGHL